MPNDDVVRHCTVMSYMNVAHKIAVAANARDAFFFFRCSVYRDTLTQHVAVTDYDFGFSTLVANVLRVSTEYSVGRNQVVFPMVTSPRIVTLL